MDAKMCLKKLEYVGVLAFATVDKEGAPQIRNISAIHYEDGAMYFLRQRAKISVRSLWRTAVFRCWDIQNIRK